MARFHLVVNAQTNQETLVPYTPEEESAADVIAQAMAERASLLAADNEVKNTAKADAVINYLVTHTPAEIVAYVNSNVANLAEARNLLGKLAVAISAIARNQLR